MPFFFLTLFIYFNTGLRKGTLSFSFAISLMELTPLKGGLADCLPEAVAFRPCLKPRERIKKSKILRDIKKTSSLHFS